MTTFGEILAKAAEGGASFEVLEAGLYVGKIIESEYKLSGNSKPQIKTRWEVTQGPKAGFKGLWNHFTLTTDNPAAMSIFYRQMTALGITNDFLGTLANLDPETAMKQIAMALNGRSAQIKVKVDQEWQNNKIERINPLPPEMAAMQSAGAGSPFPGIGAALAPVPVSQPVVPAPAEAVVPAPAPVAESVPQPAPAPANPLPAAPF